MSPRQNDTSPEKQQARSDATEQTVCGTPVNGGLQAWLQVAGSFFLFFNSGETVNTFGVFQTFYEIELLKDQSSSNVSWVGAIQAFLLLVVGVVTGPLYNAGYFYVLGTTGSVLIVVGFMALSVCTEYWQVLLAQAFCVGVGNGCLYIPSVAIIPQYFSSRKAIATAVAASGSTLGGVLYPIMFRQLQPQTGFGWAARVLGFLVLGTTLFSPSVMSVRQVPKQRRTLIEFSAFKKVPCTLFCVAMFFGYIGFFNPIFYIEAFAIQKHAMGETLAFHLISILNATSVPGRIVPGLLGLRFGPLNILLGSAIISGILSLCWIAIYNAGALIVLAVLYGFSGAFVSLLAVALTTLNPNLQTLRTRMGMCSLLCGFGSLCRAPVAGAILDNTRSYLGVQLYSGLTIGTTGVLLFFANHLKRRTN
ncbi:hypothetical protein KXX13_004684 [Aspergillus fumigatus]|nr:hypothetical protein KXX13_004684 [Aspergillus fumigatus]KAH1562462.1 hypothetical protein KXX17_004600 [Aspergillus fumigatus]KAH1595896.1 hypothetical protein KXX44_006862 [Aspergillus fumigatus]KAH1893692.1 hypothetical protein KXW69_002578 [Aspergillus fumigatus]KAH2064219.1 hypothetical protein KXX03_002229 [Aspergillus fumigatus]